MKLLVYIIFFVVFFCKCSPAKTDSVFVQPPNNAIVASDVDLWLTKGDQSEKLQKQNTMLVWSAAVNNFNTIDVDDTQTYQAIDGFGYTLTGGSAQVICQLSNTKKQELLYELFDTANGGIGISYLRVSIGASDLNTNTFSYDDVASGQTDINLTKFSLNSDTTYLIPLLKDILRINPSIKIMATPWSAPVWMKDNNNFKGGSLLPQYYDVYAKYFVKYIQKMQENGIAIDAITPQNEPLHDGNNPSMLMTAAQQANFIKNNLGPAFATANIATKIIIYDHNCDKPDYPIAVLNDALAASYINGSAFHLYAGNISALTTVQNAFPSKNLYFTEQYTSSTGTFDGDLKWHLKNVIVGSLRNWSKNALEWNLASNASFGPSTPGGCTTCKGAITVESNTFYTKNVGFYIVAHASKFVPAGSVRIASNITGNLNNVAFKTPNNKFALIVENDGNTTETFNIKFHGRQVTTSLVAGAVGTFIWQ
ncbi:MAG: glycoside hydrolase [Flavobacterium sp.]|nr:glycoside hydrolase [Flavobacterium sp.]